MGSSLSFILIIISTMSLLACSSSEASKRSVASEAVAKEQEAKWLGNYKLSQKTCKKFEDFLKQEAPTLEIKAVAELRYAQKCNKKENVLNGLKFEWLRKDAIMSGLREASTPDLFSQYYESYLGLDVSSRASLVG